jgi:hypothetical protein
MRRQDKGSWRMKFWPIEGYSRYWNSGNMAVTEDSLRLPFTGI